ncbi:unnamed protein product [Effrenium voratum]|nr:unnamed protein product [Effrenium voratum]
MLSWSEACHMDPQQRLLLELFGGEAPQPGDAAVCVGTMTLAVECNDLTSRAPSILSNRLSYVFDLIGPSYTCDTACASSLNALQGAARELGEGCSRAYAAGCSVISEPRSFKAAEAMHHLLSPKDRCKTFDASADGIARGEAVGLLCLQKTFDNVCGSLLAVSTGHNGRTAVLTTPSADAQRSVILRAQEKAGLSPSQIDLLEAHGTGTRIGDLMELQGLHVVFGQDRTAPLVLGALKTQIGHSEGAAGLMSVIKALLSSEKRCMPRNLHFEQLVEVDFDMSWAGIPSTCVELPKHGAHFGISSFGFGGALCHAIVAGAGERLSEVTQPVEPQHQRQQLYQQHLLLGQQLQSDPGQFHFLSGIDSDAHRFWDHIVDGVPVFPAEASLEMMFALARLLRLPLCLQKVRFIQLLALTEPRELHTAASFSGSDLHVTIRAMEKPLATGIVASPDPTQEASRKLPLQPPKEFTPAQIYSTWPSYGVSFRLIERLQLFETCSWAVLRPPADHASRTTPTGLLDAVLQVLAFSMLTAYEALQAHAVWVPTQVGSVNLLRVLSAQSYKAYAWWEDINSDMPDLLVGHVELLSEGTCVATLRNCHFRRRDPHVSSKPPADLQALTLKWKELKKPIPAEELSTLATLRLTYMPGRQSQLVFQGKQAAFAGMDGMGMEETQMLARVINALKDTPVVVRYIWPAPRAAAQAQSDADLIEESEAICKQMLHVMQQLEKCDVNIHKLLVVTQGAIPVGNGPVNLAQSVLSGMCRGLQSEKLRWNVTHVDVDSGAEEWSHFGEPVIAARGGLALGLRLERVDQPDAAFRPRENDHFLITGGLGGLGQTVAAAFWQQGVRRLTLLTRSWKPGCDFESFPGAEILYSDVCDLTELPSSITGIIHAAGVLFDERLGQMSWQSFADVLHPKVHGAWHLHRLSKTLPDLSVFSLFSSSSTVLGYWAA